MSGREADDAALNALVASIVRNAERLEVTWSETVPGRRDLDLLDALSHLVHDAEEAQHLAVRTMREKRPRPTWEEIGDRLGLTKQGAWEKFTRTAGAGRTPTPPDTIPMFD